MSRRLTVGQRILVPSVGVRFSPAQPCIPGEADTARSSSGLGRRPLKAEITSSNLVRATIRQTARSSSGLGRRPLKAEITSSNLVRATRNPQVRALSLACFAISEHPLHPPLDTTATRICLWVRLKYSASTNVRALLPACEVGHRRGVSPRGSRPAYAHTSGAFRMRRFP